VINNAQRACDLVQEAGTLAAYFWSFEPAAHELEAHCDRQAARATSALGQRHGAARLSDPPSPADTARTGRRRPLRSGRRAHLGRRPQVARYMPYSRRKVRPKSDRLLKPLA